MRLTCTVHTKKHKQMERKPKESFSFQWFLPFFVVHRYFLYPFLSLFLLSSLPPTTNFTLPSPCSLPSYFCFHLPFPVLTLHFQFPPLCFSLFRIVPFPSHYLLSPFPHFFSLHFHVFSFSWSISFPFLCPSLCLSCYSPISCFYFIVSQQLVHSCSHMHLL